MDDLRVEDWEEMIDVNLKGVLYGIAEALPVFREQGFGHFVNIVSTAGLRGTVVSPGFVRTDFADRMDAEVKVQIVEKMDSIAIPPAAVARAVAFAVERPDGVDVGDIVVRPTAQD
ncbi:SDR family oxidoreductase [Streptomyces mirabilis]|uniref:SDR family oxidoreductase n=1 Tax=Streptomyces mirabilis TaxID=68239 RepID=UPI0036A815D9